MTHGAGRPAACGNTRLTISVSTRLNTDNSRCICYGIYDTNAYGEITDVVEKPDESPSNLVMAGFYTFTPAIFHACHLVQSSNRSEYEVSDAVDLLIQSGRTIDAIGLEG